MPERLRHLIDVRLLRLSEDEQELLELAANLGQGVSPEQLARVAADKSAPDAVFEHATAMHPVLLANLDIQADWLENATQTLDEAHAIGTEPDAQPALERVAKLQSQLRAESASAGRRSSLPACLSRREAEVLMMLAGGASNREIADAQFLSFSASGRSSGTWLGCSTRSGVNLRAEAIAFAILHGMVAAEPSQD